MAILLVCSTAAFAGGRGDAARGSTGTASAGSNTIVYGSRLLLPENVAKGPVWEYLQKTANVTVDYQVYDDDQMALVLASGDLPDILEVNQRHLPNIVQNNLALNLDTIMDQHLPFVKHPLYKLRNEISRKLLGGANNAFYFIGPGVGPEGGGGLDNSPRGYGVRWDYYKEIGAPPINNNDDYIAAIKAMAAKHPTTPDGRKMMGVGLEKSFYNFFGLGFITNGLDPWVMMNSQYMADMETNEIHNGFTDTNRSAYWSDMKLYYKLNQAGLFDTESFSMTLDQYNAKLESESYVAMPIPKTTMYDALRKKDPNTLAAFTVVPSTGAAVYTDAPHQFGSAPDNTIFLSSKSKKWEAAARFINEMHNPDFLRTLYSGFKGKDWDYDANGKPYIMESTVQARSQGGEAWDRLGIHMGWSNIFMSEETAVHPDGYYMSLFMDPEFRAKGLGRSPFEKDYCEFYGVSYHAEATQRLVDAGRTYSFNKDFVQPIAAGLSDAPMDITRIVQNLNNILERAAPRLITAANDAAFQAEQNRVLEELRAAGEPKAWEWVRTTYNKTKPLMDSIIREYNTTYFDSIKAAYKK
jgi:ABC-type glycerol-3-phosphate transport system substrate-binding protein